jgi:hypothetical protein
MMLGQGNIKYKKEKKIKKAKEKLFRTLDKG